ncbi:MAG: TraR/DksA family transcriptional regulator [Bacteroidia bacterium]|nr:TraR/DksA C4-type zinc finger protein [Bacteroidia bacterium]NNC85504.1 TraR/DksA family transcriptional regulator [Bacteroidia bacterium]NNM16505.1 TraR/DksA family transcriptional regulator [Bacteroidia bacterium]
MESKLILLADDIEDLKEQTKPIAPENAIGRISRMDAINNKSVNEAALRSSLDKQQKMEHALEIIDTEEFGKCIRCKRDIPFGRLYVMPESEKCIECARK